MKKNRPSFIPLTHTPPTAAGRLPPRTWREIYDYLDRRTGDGQCLVMTIDTPQTLSPAQAAKRANVGRTTIMRALSSGELRGVRDNRNSWRIASEDVDAWCGHRPVIDRAVTVDIPGHVVVTPMDTPETLARLAVAEARLSDALERIEDLKRERDEWRSQAKERPQSFFNRLTESLFGSRPPRE